MKNHLKTVLGLSFILAIQFPSLAIDFKIYERTGGIWSVPIWILTFYAIWVIGMRFLYFRKAAKYDTKLLEKVKKYVNKEVFNTNDKAKIDAAIDNALVAIDNEESAFAAVVKEGLQSHKLGYGTGQIQTNMENQANIEVSKLEYQLNHLGLIAGLAPTLGFIGTIIGVINIFESIASKSGGFSVNTISEGLSIKMGSSMMGLIAGAVAYVGFHLFNAAIDTFVLKMQRTTLEFSKLSKI